MDLTAYEQRIVDEIEEFKTPEHHEPGMVEQTLRKVNDQISEVGERLSENATVEALLESRAVESLSGSTDQARDAVTKAVRGIVDLLNDGSAYTVDREGIYERYREAGFEDVDSPEDIREVPLKQIERLLESTSANYKSMAFAEGGAAGMTGAAGLAADIPALVGLALRAVNEYATYYGCDIDREQERIVALNVLLTASSVSEASKQAAVAELTKVSLEVTDPKTENQADASLAVEDVEKLAEKLGIRLIRAKLGQLIPIIGAAVGGGYNAWYISAVTETAQSTYRERYLVDRHGPGAKVTAQDGS